MSRTHPGFIAGTGELHHYTRAGPWPGRTKDKTDSLVMSMRCDLISLRCNATVIHGQCTGNTWAMHRQCSNADVLKVGGKGSARASPRQPIHVHKKPLLSPQGLHQGSGDPNIILKPSDRLKLCFGWKRLNGSSTE